MDQILQRLYRMEDAISDAAVAGGEALSDVLRSLGDLFVDLESVITTIHPEDPQLSEAADASRRILTLSELYMDLQNTADEMAASIKKEMQAAFSSISLDNLPRLPGPSTRYHETQSARNGNLNSSRPALYIESAYHWLLDNLHNPYPSKEIRESLAQRTGSSRQSIDAWFIDVRRRIGWNELRRKRFSNKREDIVAAAACFFSPDGSGKEMEVGLEMDFAGIQQKAKDLYSHKFMDQELIQALELSKGYPDSRKRSKRQRDDRDRRQHRKKATLCSYPTPPHSSDEIERSIPSSPYRAFNQELPKPSIEKGKRRMSSPNGDEERIKKRPRLEAEPDNATRSISPAACSDDTCTTFSSPRFNETLLDHRAPSFNTRKRMRTCTPDSEIQEQHASVHPPHLSRSTPSMDTSTLENWFQDDSVGIGDASNVQLNISVFNYGHSEDVRKTPPLNLADTEIPSISHTVNEPLSTLDSLEIATGPFDYDGLFNEVSQASFGRIEHANFQPGCATTQANSPSSDAFGTETLGPSNLAPVFSEIPLQMPPTPPDTTIHAQWTSTDFSNWFSDAQVYISPADTTELLPSVLPTTSALFSSDRSPEASFIDFSQPTISYINPQEAKRRRLEAIRMEALALERELASFSSPLNLVHA